MAAQLQRRSVARSTIAFFAWLSAFAAVTVAVGVVLLALANVQGMVG